MSLNRYVRQLKPIQENKVDYVQQVQDLYEELSPSEELQEAIKLVEKIDSKISGINGETELRLPLRSNSIFKDNIEELFQLGAATMHPNNYIEKYKMPWLSVENQSEDSRNLLQFANVYSLPSLVILSPDGRIITQNGVADINDRSEGALEYWKKTIDG